MSAPALVSSRVSTRDASSAYGPCRAIPRAASVVLLVVTALSGVAAQDEDDDENPFRPGLIARYRDAADRVVVRVDASPTLHADLASTDERLVAGPYQVRWEGKLWVQNPGPHRLAIWANGRTRIRLNGDVVLQTSSETAAWHVSAPLELEFDRHALQVEHESKTATSQLSLYWSSASFPLEPIPTRFLLHAKPESPQDASARGRELVRALRCAACHTFAGQPAPLAAPALDRLQGNLQRDWVARHLTVGSPEMSRRPDDGANGEASPLARRMPYFSLTATDVADLTAYLYECSLPLAPPAAPPVPRPPVAKSTPAKEPSAGKGGNKPAAAAAPRGPHATAGLALLRTVGCLACHTHAGLGTHGPFDGGDLTAIAEKRPADFFARWLADPASLQRDHRMPVFELSPDERLDLAALLATRPPSAEPRAEAAAAAAGDAKRGAQLFRSQGCVACHSGPDAQRSGVVNTAPLHAESRWSEACLGAPSVEPRRPGYRLTDADRAAIQGYVAELPAQPAVAPPPVSPPPASKRPPLPALSGRDRVRESHCLACHVRDDAGGIGGVALEVIKRAPELSPLLPAFSPPPLTGVGDKLRDEALDAAVRRTSGARRPWLAVRMPKFAWGNDEVAAVVSHLVAHDRVPDSAPAEARAAHVAELSTLGITDIGLRATGGRLVTQDGFGCTSCHAVGSVQPPPAPLNARGPDLSQLGRRIRSEWFDRWVRSPARMVPRMEMPSVQVPVRGVLGERLDHQLAAVWHVLNLPDFAPPEPNPVQTLRLTGVPERRERAELITDVVLGEGKTWIKPLLIGLPNRHNLLFDLETNRLARWSLGDVARQRTKGKSWYWEAAGVDLLRAEPAPSETASELTWEQEGRRVVPSVVGQFPTEADGWRHGNAGLVFSQRLRFNASSDDARDAARSSPWSVSVEQSFAPLEVDSLATRGGFRRTLTFLDLPLNASLRFRATTAARARNAKIDASRHTLSLDDGATRLEIETPNVRWDDDGTVLIPFVATRDLRPSLTIAYRTSATNDQFVPVELPPARKPSVDLLPVAPGFVAQRLPLDERQMPTALAWRPDGELLVASLKGRVLVARDADGDGFEDTWNVFSDELAAPYGVAAAGEAVDVATKFAVLRLWDDDRDGRADRVETVASGWGHTADYHDWTVGLPSDGQGGYFVGLACQQDKRSAAAAHLRGTVLRLVAPSGGLPSGQRFQVEPVTGGHRFPMGLARNRAGDLFVTDNQGNYNPFNELNHVRTGLRYGFINANEQKPEFRPVAEPAAIEIPHPWTRSVNGICFLDVPATNDAAAPGSAKAGEPARPFGPFTGHLVGCEYDTRRLVRMSLQKIGDTYQGAVYPLTYDEPRGDAWLLGPLTCAVSPRGDLYVGGIRDSGWGGGNNLGEIVRLRFAADQLPAGIAEVRAAGDGFDLDFTRPLNRDRLRDAANYVVSSYRRISTPAYGGNDVDRRDERIQSVLVADDGLRAHVQLAELRPGYVYEFRLRNLTLPGDIFHPTEAYFTLRQVVDR